MTKKKINAKLIKFQNKFGKKLGKAAWQQWKLDNVPRTSIAYTR